MANHTFLDHSSADALVADLERRIQRHGALKSVLYYAIAGEYGYYREVVTTPWVPVNVGRHGDKFPLNWNGGYEVSSLWLRSRDTTGRGRADDRLVLCDGLGGPRDGPFLLHSRPGGTPLRFALSDWSTTLGVDGTLRRKIDKNLQGIFS